VIKVSCPSATERVFSRLACAARFETGSQEVWKATEPESLWAHELARGSELFTAQFISSTPDAEIGIARSQEAHRVPQSSRRTGKPGPFSFGVAPPPHLALRGNRLQAAGSCV
jgi:hypothetical protein